MTCTQTRLAISALLDGEDPGVNAARARAHLAGCAACQAWQASAEQVTRAVRITSVEVPDLTEQVLAAVAADQTLGSEAARRAAAAHGRRQILRVALAVSALAQLILGLPLLVSGAGGDVLHVSREMASFDVAVAVGFLFAAWRPARAAALVPIAVALSLCLLLTSTLDVATNGAAAAHEIGHLLAVLQAALLWALGRTNARPAPLTTGIGARTAA